MPRAKGVKQVAANRKALHDYFVLERFEAGVELFGTEVKSIRAGTVNLKDSFCTVKDGELFAYGIHISPYEHGSIFNRDPVPAEAPAHAPAGDHASSTPARSRTG